MKYKLSSSFGRRKLESMGDRLNSIKKLSKYDARVFTFSYRSKGTNPYKPRQNKDPQPLLLIAYKNRQKSFKINKKTYMYGFNLNYLPKKERLDILKRIKEDYADWNGAPVDYKTLKNILKLPTSKENSIFRKYRTLGGNLTRLVAIDLDTYIEELRISLEGSKFNT